jgi:autotransporter-associated beta strand protein
MALRAPAGGSSLRFVKSRTSRVLAASFLLLFCGLVPLSAQLIWVGGLSTGSYGPNDATDPVNWSGEGTLAGDGSDDVFFGDTGTRTVYIGTDAALTNISFGNGSSATYNFHGDDDGSSLTVLGNLSADPGSSAIFNEDLDVFLTEGAHTASIGGAASITIGSRIADASGATGGISKTGDGNLTLAGANLFTGGVTVAGGTLTLAHDSNYDGMIYSSPVGLGTLVLNNGSTLTMLEEYSYGLYNDIQLDATGGTVYIDVPNYSDLHIASSISGAAALDKSGDGTLILSNGTSDFSGGFSLHKGTLMLAASSQAEGSAVTNGPVGTGGLKLYDGTTLGADTGGALTLHNAIELDCRAEAKVDVWTNGGSTLNLYGVISGAAELNNTGTGILNLYGDNTFTGDFYVSGGTVNVHANTGTGMGALEFGTAPSALNFLSSAPVVHGLSSDSPYQTVSLAGSSTFTINQGDTEEEYNFQGSIGATSASVVKNGAGTQVFSGTNNYTGGTTINDGVLVANHGNGSNVVDALGTGAVTVNGGALKIAEGLSFANPLNFGVNGGTLGGSGTFAGPLTLGAGVIIAPGNSPGILTISGNLIPNDGLVTQIEINGAANTPGTTVDQVFVTGTLNLSSLSANGYKLQIISLDILNTPGAVAGLSAPASWTIFSSGTLTGFNAGLFDVDQSGFVNTGVFSLTQSGNDILLNFTPVPEPSTYALLALGLAGSGLAAWRKRRRA